MSQLAHEFGLCRKTVHRWLQADGPPRPSPLRGARRKSVMDPYAPYLERRLAEGCTNRTQLWREIQAQGSTSTRSLVSKWICAYLDQHRMPAAPISLPLPSAKRLVWLLLRDAATLTLAEQQLLRMLQQEPSLTVACTLAQEFLQIVRRRLPKQLDRWLAACAASGISAFHQFAKGLHRDYAAVKAALSLPWSNGPAEGHINRLKLLKRQMYGRANFDLLQLRVLYHV